MQLQTLDWAIIAVFFLVSLGIGLYASRSSGDSTKEFFLSGRNMPWWLLGVSMVATTFSADTPNLVTDIVRKNGVAGNWAWWAFLLTGMLTVFVYARLWRRSGVMTDLEFYEMRYSGRPARFLRQFRAIYLGVFFNVMIMATVCLAGIKIAGVLLGMDPITTVLTVSVVTVFYSALGGFKGVVITDFVQFIFAMIGAIWAAIYLLSNNLGETAINIGGLDGLFSHPNVVGKLDIIPSFEDPAVYVPLLVVPIAIQWWSVWYPGAEPGGGGYVAQRMLAAKNEKHAVGATLLFNAFHYALRPWPWILIALASLVVFPDLVSIQNAFPEIPIDKVKDDLAYSAMLSFLPKGLLGLVIASLIAALMSTLSTHLNWGSSYVVHDWYQRFIKPDATEKEMVNIGRLSTVLLMVLSALLALALSNALEAFNILLQVGAGTGLIFILRWFWWRINAYTEITGMAVSFLVALSFLFYKIVAVMPEGKLVEDVLAPWQIWIRERLINTPSLPHLEDWQQLLIGVGITTASWLMVTFMTKPTDRATLESFYTKIHPGGPGWEPVANQLPADVTVRADSNLTIRIAAVFIGAIGIYSVLFATGFYLYGNLTATLISAGLAVFGIGFLWINRSKL